MTTGLLTKIKSDLRYFKPIIDIPCKELFDRMKSRTESGYREENYRFYYFQSVFSDGNELRVYSLGNPFHSSLDVLFASDEAYITIKPTHPMEANEESRRIQSLIDKLGDHLELTLVEIPNPEVQGVTA